ncbi:hypothetical protein J6590_038930 [Homalodisca vitripennis]|nr:hypothetical protein J6590_038930 [Homalodisca vitripennis]
MFMQETCEGFPVNSRRHRSRRTVDKKIKKRYFDEVIKALKTNNPCSKKLRQLDPILENDLLRVGYHFVDLLIPESNKTFLNGAAVGEATATIFMSKQGVQYPSSCSHAQSVYLLLSSQ